MTRSRLSLDVSPEFRQVLDTLAEKTSAGSLTEVIRRAVNLLDTVEGHRLLGGSVQLVHANGERETLRLL